MHGAHVYAGPDHLWVAPVVVRECSTGLGWQHCKGVFYVDNVLSRQVQRLDTLGERPAEERAVDQKVKWSLWLQLQQGIDNL